MGKLGKIKDMGVQVATTAAGKAVGVVSSVAGRKDAEASAPEASAPEASAPEPSAPEPSGPKSGRTEPVNVTEELGLDPAPVAEPKPAKEPPASEPVTKIDAAADPSQVDVTPADVAEVVSGDGSSAKKQSK